MSVETAALDAARRLLEQEQRLLREAKELDLLIESTQTEVNRLRSREEQARAKLEEIRTNPTEHQREDIFPAAEEHAQSLERRTAMEGQLAALQSKRRYLETVRGLIAEAAAAARAVEAAPPSPAPVPSAPAVDERSMRRAVVDAQEEERQRLARAVHDGPAQSLANVVLQAEISERLFAMDPERSRAELASLRSLVNRTLQDLRGFIFELRPMILDDLGIVPTTRRYVQTLVEKHGVRIDFSSSGRDRRLPAGDEIALFRVLQDALLERIERAQAKSLQLAMQWEDRSLETLLQSDGKAPAAGFRSARNERLDLIRGEASEDVRADGTLVLRLRVPLQPLTTIS